MSHLETLAAREQKLLMNAIGTCHEIDSQARLKKFVQGDLCNLIPHEKFACGFGATADYQVLSLINFDFPDGYIRSIIDPKGAIHSHTIISWRRTGAPQFYNSADIDEADSMWRRAFEEYSLQNVGGFGVSDYHRSCAAYFGFGDLERKWDERQAYYMELVVPHLYLVAQNLTLDQAKNPVIPTPPENRPSLSPREREVLQWVAAGKSSWDIGMILGISSWTVKVHIRHAMRKLNVFTRSHAVAKAMQLGLIDL